MRKLVLLLIAAGILGNFGGSIYAQQNCNVGANRADAISNIVIPVGNYSVYLKGTANAQPNNTITVQLNQYNCAIYGPSNPVSNSPGWYKSANSFIGDGAVRSYIWNRTSSDILESDSNIDTMLLVDSTVECIPSQTGIGDCSETLPSGETVTIKGSALSSIGDSLKVYIVKPYKNKVVSKVDYYVDGSFRYKSNKLEAIDAKYLKDYAPQTIDRVVTFVDGSQVTYSQKNEKSGTGDLLDLFFSFGILNNTLIRNGVIGVLALCFVVGFVSIIRHIYIKRKWRHDHIVGS